MDDRDAKLKAIFTDDQYNKWKNDIEPAMRPQRGNRQGQQ
jgi:protein CpxP